MTIVFTSHNPHHALVAADDAMLLFNSEDAMIGPADETLRANMLSRLYGHPMTRLPPQAIGAVDLIAPLLSSTHDKLKAAST